MDNGENLLALHNHDSENLVCYTLYSGSNEIGCIDKLDKQFVIEHSLKGFLEKVHESNVKVFFLESDFRESN